MVKLQIPFSNQVGESVVEQNSRETLINMFGQIEISGRRKIIRRQRMGVDQVYALAGEKRCIEKNAGKYWLVVADKFYEFDGVSTLTERGTLDTSTGRCTMIFDENGDVGISDGTTFYLWDGSTFSKPSTQTFVDTLTFVGGYAVYNEPDKGQFWWSAVNDMTSWGALDFATAEAKSDPIVRVFESFRELWLLGSETTEVWTLSGDSGVFIFQAAMERGCRAALSVVGEDNSVFWLGDDDIFYRADGYRPVRVSNHSVEELIGVLSDSVKATAEAFSYTDRGHKFITLNFPGYLTVQLNLATGLWNVCRTFGQDDWDLMGSQYTQCDMYLTDSGIAQLQRGINTDNGGIMERGGVSAPISEGSSRVLVNTFFLDCEVARAGIGVDPQVMMRVARDGETFGNERWRSLGTIGNYSHRTVWRNLGIGRRMAVEVMVTGDFEFSILGADVEGDLLDG